MLYFIRTTLVYLVLFIAVALGIQWVFYTYYATEDMQATHGPISPSLMFSALPQAQVTIRETESGLLLSGLVAQSRRDWNHAWQNFSTLNQKFEDHPDIALRAFTLALGNGAFDEALVIAENLNTYFLEENDARTQGAPYDLVRLFLLLNALKDTDDDMEFPDLYLQGMRDNGALARFSLPLVNAWVKPDSLNADDEGLSSLQIYYKALAAEYAGKNDIAQDLMDIIRNDFSSVEQLQNLIAFYVRLDNPNRAREVLDQGLEFFTDNDALNATQAQLSDESVAYDPPAYAAYHLQHQNHGIALAFLDFSRVMVREGVTDSALLFAQKAAFLNPQTPSVFLVIGDILSAQSQKQAALAAYARVPQDDPGYETAVGQKGDLLVAQERFDEAEALFLQAVSYDPDNAYFHYALGDVFRSQERYARAIEEYNKAESLGTKDGVLIEKLWPLYYSRAIALDFSDDWPAAEADLMTAMDKFPDNPIILNYLGYAYADKNINLEKSKDMISRALMAAPTDAYIIDSMGWILYRMGEYDSAVTYLERAAMMRPYHMVINDHLGDAYWQVGRKIEAHYMWQRALDYYDDTQEEQRRMIEETRRKVREGF